jgi:hypothetical protein
MLVKELIKKLKKFPANKEVQITCEIIKSCGCDASITESHIFIDKYYYMNKKNYPKEYWVQLKIEGDEQ